MHVQCTASHARAQGRHVDPLRHKLAAVGGGAVNGMIENIPTVA